MNRLPSLATRWLIACLVLTSLLVGRPLHELRHLGDVRVAGVAAVAAGVDDPAGEPDAGQEGGSCVWCLFHVPALLVCTVLAMLALLCTARAVLLPRRAAPLVVCEIRAAAPRGPP